MSHIYSGTAAALMTPKEIGKIYQVSADTVLRWHHEGKIPAVVAEGQIYRFDGEAVAKALQLRARQKARKARSAGLA
jgi:excisionase family DNA binding protein